MVSHNQQHIQGEKLPNSTTMPSTGVLLKMYVDGPFGSAVRARWGEHSTVVIFVAGSGVSFGLSILEYVCLCLAGRDGRYLGGRPGGWASKGFNTRRVKFVWMIREFGEYPIFCIVLVDFLMDSIYKSIHSTYTMVRFYPTEVYGHDSLAWIGR